MTGLPSYYTKRLTYQQKIGTQVVGWFWTSALFTLVWDVFKVYEAVGHGFGSVNYWTVFGVDWVASIILMSIFAAIYSTRRYSNHVSFYSPDE